MLMQLITGQTVIGFERANERTTPLRQLLQLPRCFSTSNSCSVLLSASHHEITLHTINAFIILLTLTHLYHYNKEYSHESKAMVGDFSAFNYTEIFDDKG